MKTIIYTYENKKPVFFEKSRFYKIKTRKEYSALIDELILIDAVSLPFFVNEAESYPFYLELKSGFSPKLVKVSKKYIKKEIKKVKKIIDS